MDRWLLGLGRIPGGAVRDLTYPDLQTHVFANELTVFGEVDAMWYCLSGTIFA